MMRAVSVAISALSLLAMIIVGALSIRAVYAVNERGSHPKKRLDVAYIGPISPMRDLTNAGDMFDVYLKSNGEKIRDVQLYFVTLTNAGSSPVLPSEYFEPLRLEVRVPWRILGISASGFRGDVKLKWHQIDKNTVEASPTLLNPGDSITANVYITREESVDAVDKDGPNLHWTGRIVNLRNFTGEKSPLDAVKYDNWIMVDLHDWAVIFTIFCYSVFYSLYVLTLFRTGLLRPKWWSVVTLVVAGIFSISASEATTTYLFPTPLTAMTGVNPWMNLPPILVNAIFLLLLVWSSLKYANDGRNAISTA